MNERFRGVWNGEHVDFPREWRGVMLTEKQCNDLLDGKEVEIVGLISHGTGNPYGVVARLGHLTSKATGNEYIGIEQVSFLSRERLVELGIRFPIPKSFCQHVFTEDELTMLEQGLKVKIDDAYSKKYEKTFSCTARYDQATQRIIIE